MSPLLPLALFIVALTFAGFSNSQSQENRKYWNDKGDRDEFVRELRARNVPFRVDTDGVIWYSSKHVEIVDAISKEMLAKPIAPGISYSDPRDQAEFQKRLDSERIPYEVRRRYEKDWILWDKKFDARVREIQEVLEGATLTRLRGERSKR